MKKFEIGKTYYDRSICNHDCIYAFKVVGRTAKTISIEYRGQIKKCRVLADSSKENDAEVIRPLGNYSMAPIISANCYEVDRPLEYKEEQPVKSQADTIKENYRDSAGNIVEEGDVVGFYPHDEEIRVTDSNVDEFSMSLGIIEHCVHHPFMSPTFIIRGLMGDNKTEMFGSSFIKKDAPNGVKANGKLNVRYTAAIGKMQEIEELSRSWFD